MPQFTQWNVPSPFSNVLFNPAAVDKSIAELGHLGVERERLDLDRAQMAKDQAFTDRLIEAAKNAAGTETGSAPTGGGGGGSFLSALADIESGDKNIVSGTDKDNRGLTLAQGGNPTEISQGHFQIHTGTWKDFAPQAGVDVSKYPNAMSAPREIQAQVASVIPFKRFGPRTQAMMRERFGDFDSNQPVGVLAGLGPRVAPAAPGARAAPTQQAAAPSAPVIPPPFNPAAGPRVGSVPPAAAPAIVPPSPTTAQIPPPVRAAAQALLAMPEAEAAVAYGPIVKELQARGLAQNAPPEYPGHEATAALVGGEPATPDVAPARQAMRLGGTAAAGPAAGQTPTQPDVILDASGNPLLPPPPAPAPNRMAYGTGLPGVTIGLPTNGLAPPPAAAPPSPGTASGGAATRAPVLQQPAPAPSRVIPMDPQIQSGLFAGLTRKQAMSVAEMSAGGAKPAAVMLHIDQLRQHNDVLRQQNATAAAAETEANYRRHEDYRKAQKEDENTQYNRGRQAETDRRAAEKEAREAKAAEDLLQGKSEDERIERTLLQIAPKIRNGQPLTDAELDQYSLLWNKYRAGPVQDVPDGKGGFFKANVPREVPARFPPPPGQTVTAGPQAIPGTEKPPEMAGPTIAGGMLANGTGQRKLMNALTGLLAHPDAVGLKANTPDWLLQRTDPEGVELRSAISNVAGHEFHDLSGAAISPTEAARLKYIPSEKDSAATIKTKLQQMLDLNRETMLQSYRTYGPENGFRKLPAVEEAIIDSIPEAAMDALKADPKARTREFDKRYGKGAAKLVLQ